MMADGDNSTDWPTLSDSNIACSTTGRNKHGEKSKDWPKLSDSSNTSKSSKGKEVSTVKPDVTEGATGIDNSTTSTNSKTGARKKKQHGKIKWSHLELDPPPYRETRSDRYHNESRRFFGNGRRFNNHESVYNATNGYENSRGRAFRGGRGHFRSRRDNAVNSESTRYQRGNYQETPSVSYTPGADPNQAVCFADELKNQIMRQIEYYFSEKNLIKDTYLRCQMDDQGYASLSLISDFPRIKRLTNNLPLILEAVKSSSHLEVSEDLLKIRPVVDPLRWPLKIDESYSVNVNEPYVDIIAAQMFGMSLDPSVYQHIPGLKSHLPGELPWHYIPIDDQEKNYCMANDPYHVISNGMAAAASNSDIPNGHVSPSEHLSSPNSDLPDELASQYVSNNFEMKNGDLIFPMTDIPSHNDSNGVNGIDDDTNVSNGQNFSDYNCPIPSGHVCSTSTLNTNSEFELSDMHYKSIVPFYPANGIRPHEDVSANTSGVNIPNGFAYSSEQRHATEITTYSCYFGQVANGVIMYSSGGHYYVSATEISTNSSDEKTTSHNKSPEPSR